jgi:hypothetical protein
VTDDCHDVGLENSIVHLWNRRGYPGSRRANTTELDATDWMVRN